MIDIVMLADCASDANLEMTDNAVRSYLAQSVGCRVYLVESSGRKMNSTSKRVTIIQPREKFNYNKFLQIGLGAIENPQPFVLISNNDVVAYGNALAEMIRSLKRFHSVSPRDETHRHHRKIKQDTAGYTVTVHVCGWCICFRREVLTRIKPADLFPVELTFWYQDNFYADMLKHFGFKHGLCIKANVVHLESQSHSLIEEKEKHARTHGLRDAYTALKKKYGL